MSPNPEFRRRNAGQGVAGEHSLSCAGSGLLVQPQHQAASAIQQRPGIPDKGERDGIGNVLGLQPVEVVEVFAQRRQSLRDECIVNLLHWPPPASAKRR